MNNFVTWLDSGKYTPTGEAFDVGHTCLAAIKAYCCDGKAPLECGQSGEYANGNGSLMRIHPFVLYASVNMPIKNDGDYYRWMGLIKQASALTHAHDRAIMGCYIYSYCLASLLKGHSRESLRRGIEFAGRDLDHLPEFECYKRIFSPDFDKLTADEIKSSGYVVDTLEAALWCVLTTDNYRDCVLKAVNLGGDADTVAAVAGGLAGALYGYFGIPEEWRDTLIGWRDIEEMCDGAYKNWSNHILRETERKIQRLKALLEPAGIADTTFYETLDEIDAIKKTYYDYMSTSPIDAESELARLKTADYDLCCALITMLLREDHFCNGSFGERLNNGEVRPIIERMIMLLENSL